MSLCDLFHTSHGQFTAFGDTALEEPVAMIDGGLHELSLFGGEGAVFEEVTVTVCLHTVEMDTKLTLNKSGHIGEESEAPEAAAPLMEMTTGFFFFSIITSCQICSEA